MLTKTRMEAAKVVADCNAPSGNTAFTTQQQVAVNLTHFKNSDRYPIIGVHGITRRSGKFVI